MRRRRAEVRVVPAGAGDPQARALLDALTAELASGGYGPDGTFCYSPEQLEQRNVHLVAAWVGGRAVGIGGIEMQGGGVGELKRFYVAPAHRGTGVADAVIGALLEHAEAHDVDVVRLETGDRQAAAVAFYRRHGFVHVPRFGPYANSATSVCMQRDRSAQRRMLRLLGWACTAPSEALVRWCELQALDGVEIGHPVLEIGCGNGRFAAIAVGHVERAVEADPRNVVRATGLPGVYDRVDLGDVRTAAIEAGSYATVFANSVLSVVPDLAQVLAVCRQALKPGGALVATVQTPLLYAALLSERARYVRRRYRQQDIVTLQSEDRWLAMLRDAGFDRFDVRPYMPTSLARRWDAVDAPASIGRGRYRLATAVRLVVDGLPGPVGRAYHRAWARVLQRWYEQHRSGPPTQLLIVATRADGGAG